jgi:hypothetical protein
MKDSEYECNMCRGIFEKGWTDEEAKAEAEKNEFPLDECSLVCENCYNIIMGKDQTI